jgi:hypothetical protein
LPIHATRSLRSPAGCKGAKPPSGGFFAGFLLIMRLLNPPFPQERGEKPPWIAAFSAPKPVFLSHN